MYIETQGIRVPRLGFGTFRLQGDACTQAVETALRVGYRHLDTAEIYGNEDAVGEALRTVGLPRSEIFLTTKLWRDDMSPAGVERSLDRSLRKLGVDFIDLWLIHWPNTAFPLEETLDAMYRAVRDQRVRALGVSNFPVALLDRAAAVAPIACNQVEYHPYLAQTAVLDAARRHKAMIMAYSPLARGACHADPVLQTIGARHGKSAAQVALRWLLQQPNVAAIPKASGEAHAVENFDVFDFELSDLDMTTIHRLARGERRTDPDIAPDWDT